MEEARIDLRIPAVWGASSGVPCRRLGIVGRAAAALARRSQAWEAEAPYERLGLAALSEAAVKGFPTA